MNRFVSNRKCLVFCLLSFFLGPVAVSGDSGDKAFKREDTVTAYYHSIAATKNRLALEAYEKRNAEITFQPEDTKSANTDNAALLYYQACLFVSEPNESLKNKIRPNTYPSKEIRTYLGHCLPVIEMVETASCIPDCNWAVWHGTRSGWAPLRKLFLLSNILLLDATTLAVDGHYHVALERCLTVWRIGRHFGDDPELYLCEGYFHTQAFDTIKILLGMMPADAEILTWFRDEFGRVPGLSPTFAKAWGAYRKIELRGMRTDPDYLGCLRELALMQARGQQAKEKIEKLTDEEIRSRAAQAIDQISDLIVEIMTGKDDYKTKISRVHEFCSQRMADETIDPIARVYIAPAGVSVAHQVESQYADYVEQEARINGTKAAVEIYLVLAKTGKLPHQLPPNLPKDPFTGKDFGYEMTDEGFALRCAGESFKKRKEHLLEFRVRRR